ncbi:broad substrate specificity ATP-binding cassette transporter ABCG2b isoform X1 [Oncorhynchus keta]|uniref:broad substrate specificity ATP-binding cassette transporter ABCG2b isoform X1 n=2 Tax=Oncorhynchus keta TaxID=8018 RepID=UPI00227B1174|nr:broad substrate specificity ATP-binding cassette transporter ABCG2b isoform X1 [Oncorhynchus keta]XP_052356930.1 broad substrate specificity ATP-binding cassette transporter ABCG2b isoform X1 [Oncorhynchus keta]XP_052356931.1 broad substrate specificity ATP-binding cassette transporter ABCG2b isoform X1 [Oncorhynchus keta]XP_052356932.1 broad substrate specificity ATP-binding cassette transporter ABCG2b isoform X1 [Oncorhynchus keta]XP_052356933.1 broad substrate specificity ATP-binding cass
MSKPQNGEPGSPAGAPAADDPEVMFQMPGPTVSFSRLHYSVMESNGLCHKTGPEKHILKDVSGIMRPGMNAIMGPTGSGKTSLLDVIAGRKDPAGLKFGQVLIDGKMVDSDLRLISAYVVQDDILMGTLSVRENLLFSVNLRLDPQHYSTADKQQRVDSIIEDLGLQDCAHTKIGTEFLRGVSGGERKRCSIGMELITSPRLLFLDEPTTGLDSNTANHIINLLHRLSRSGKTIVFSIHQPRYSIFSRFDHLTLMHRGELVYAGAAGKALSYFTDLGYHCEPFNNPSDFFLDVTNGEAQSTLDITSFNYDDKENCDNSNLLAVSYRQSTQYQRVVEELDHLTQGLEGGVGGQGQKADYVTSFWYQMRIVGGRMVVNSLRNPQTSYAQLALNIFFALLVGLIYYQIPLTLPEALQNRMGAFFFLIINMVFGNLSAVELFINERALFIHENSSGYYRTSVYFLSKIFADLIPNRIVPILIFSAIAYYMMGMNHTAITYYMMGLKPAFTAFLLFTLTMSLVSLAAVSLAFLVSASVSSFAMANVLIALPFVFMMVFGGFLVNLNSMLSWLSWLKWISIFRYGLEAVTINEFKGQIFYSNTTILPGEVYLETQGLDYSTWGFWQNHVALSGIITVCMVLAYIQLRRINRWK